MLVLRASIRWVSPVNGNLCRRDLGRHINLRPSWRAVSASAAAEVIQRQWCALAVNGQHERSWQLAGERRPGQKEAGTGDADPELESVVALRALGTPP
jgi:hypothetical protein